MSLQVDYVMRGGTGNGGAQVLCALERSNAYCLQDSSAQLQTSATP